jgi:predicted dehydrogenase
VLGAANIAVEKVIPAMQLGARTEVVAIASQRPEAGMAAAERHGIARVHDSYEALLADPGVDAIYNPLPNHLHVPWSVRAAEAGKHVLCEKPIGLDMAEARELLAARDRTGVVIGEAFMARSHPQWLRAKELADSGAIGDLRLVTGTFSYFLRDPQNVRNMAGIGGGGLYDIGCYPITLSRLIFGEEPTRVIGLLEDDPDFGTDRLTSAILEYPSGQATFTCSTQLVPYQRMHIMGTTGRVEIEIPFNAPPDRPCRILVDDGASLSGETIQVEELPTVDQYTVQGDLFAEAIQTAGPAPTPLEEAVRNMAVIDAVFRSGRSGTWEAPEAA